MNLDAQEFLDLVEESGKIVFFDLESLGLKGDYNSIICGSFKPYGEDPYTISIKQVSNDQKVVKDIKTELEKYICWVTYYGKCMSPDTKVVTSDLKWVPIGDLIQGDKLLAFDPFPTENGRRRWREAEVISAVPDKADTVLVELENDQRFVVTPEHPFLVRGQTPPHGYRWVVAGMVIVVETKLVLE